MEPTPSKSDAQAFRYAGTVVDENGDPVSGATVTVAQYEHPNGQRAVSGITGQVSSTTTDAAGGFEIVDWSPHTAVLAAYSTWNCAVLVDGGDRIGFGLLRPGVRGTATLLASASVRVTLVDALGRPIAGVSITPESISIGGRSYMLSAACPSRWREPSGSDGNIVLCEVPRGCSISGEVADARYSAQRFHIEVAYAADFVDHRIVLTAGGEIYGRVVYQKSGDPVPFVKVQAHSRDADAPWAQALTDQQGNYLLSHVMPARYSLDIQLSAETALDWTCVPVSSVEVSDGQTSEAPDIVLVHGGVIQGQVVYIATDEPAAHVHVSIADPEFNWHRGFVTDSEGRYRAVVPPGQKYTVVLHEHHKRKVVTLGEAETVDVNFVINKPYMPDERSSIAEPLPTISVSGRVFDVEGQPVGGIVVTADWSSMQEPLHCVTSIQGFYKFNDLHSYASDSTVSALHGRLAAHVVCAPETDAVIDLVLSADLLGAVAGKVVDTQGLPIAGATVSLVSYRDGCGRYDVDIQTDLQGCYRIDPIFITGQYELAVSAPGFLDSSSKLRPLSANRTRNKAPIVLKRSRPISGTVIDSDGLPVENAQVSAIGCHIAMSDDGGKFTLTAHDGPLTIEAYGCDGSHATVKAEGGQSDIAIRLLPGDNDLRSRFHMRCPSVNA
jgi:protocatechuate 3,4-dioxygenase beta subunit